MNHSPSKYTQIALLVITIAFFVHPIATLAQDTAATAPAAQENGSREIGALSLQEREQRQLNRLNENLALSSHQQKQIKQVLAERDASLATLRNDSSLTPEDKHAKMADVSQSSAAKIRTLLTVDQQPLYDDLLASQQQYREQSRGTSTVASQSAPPAFGAAATSGF